MLVNLDKGYVAVIDDDDLGVFEGHSWRGHGLGFNNQVYMVAYLKGKSIYFHRLVMRAGKGDIIDHVDGNPLNNRKSNLRVVSASSNIRNGVFKSDAEDMRNIYKCRSRWRVFFSHHRKPKINIGYFATVKEARAARNEAALRLYGSSAPRFALGVAVAENVQVAS